MLVATASNRGSLLEKRSFLTSFSFLLFSKTLLALIKISIGGVNEGAAAFHFLLTITFH